MKLLDRLVFGTFVKAWVVCFVSMVALYVVIDAFNKLDDFLQAAKALKQPVATVAGKYYAHQLLLIFDRLCGIMLLLAAIFTLSWMQRNNELMPLLAAGIPMRRVLVPVLAGTLLFLSVSVINRECVIPQIAEQLQNPAADPQGEASRMVKGTYEPNGILIEGRAAFPKDRLVVEFAVTAPEKLAGTLCYIKAKEARYIPPGPESPSGGWLLTETTPKELPPWKEPVLTMIDPGKFFLKTEQVDFALLTRGKNWYQFADTLTLYHELQRFGAGHLAPLAVQWHLRLITPLLTLLMVAMGVAMILRDHNRNMFINVGMCLGFAAAFYVLCYVARYLGEQEYLTPALAAWLPVLAFGPVGLAALDGIKT